MDVQLHFPDGTLSTEHQALVETLNRFLALHPANGDEDAVLRLVMELLELADVAPQPEIARAVGYSQARSLRTFKQRLEEEGLGGLFDQPITGRPAVTSQPAVERAVVQATLEAVITEHALPDDGVLAQAVNGHLAEAQEPWEVTASMVETIRLRLGIQRLLLAQQLEAANDSQSPVQEKVRLGRTKAGGAFILAILLVETGWLKLAELLPMAPHYAVTTVQWLLTAIFAIIYDVRRAFYLDDVRDIGFALITGRARPLSHSTFQHLLHAIPAEAARRFYEATARQIIRGLGAGVRRISLDGHNLPRYTKVVDVVKGKIGNTGRVLKAEEMVLAFDLDAWLWLALRVYQGAKKLSQALLEMVTELRKHRGDIKGLWRIFFDKGGYKGQNFQALSDLPDVHFYCPAVRYESNVAQWEQLTEKNFEAEPFVFTKHADLPAEQRPIYRLADTAMTVNIREKHRVVGSVELRAIVINDPEGQT